MATFVEIKTRVADELDRDDLTSAIETAVLDAVDEHSDLLLAFNEARNTATTTASQIYVTVPTGLRRESGVWIDVSGSDYALIKKPLEFLEQLHAATTSTGQPTYYAFLDGTFRLWPTPGQAYTLTVLGVYDESALSADGDTNGFTTDRTAARMIAAWARAYIARNHTYDEDMEKAALREYVQAKDSLFRKTSAKVATGMIAPCL
jgi:hypothetical protein